MIKCKNLDWKFIRKKSLEGTDLSEGRCIYVTEHLIFLQRFALKGGGGEKENMQIRKCEKITKQKVDDC